MKEGIDFSILDPLNVNKSFGGNKHLKQILGIHKSKSLIYDPVLIEYDNRVKKRITIDIVKKSS